MPKSAAEATPPTGNRFVEFDEFIDYQLNKASKSIQSTDILVGIVGAGLGLTLYLFVFILADHWLVTGGLGTWARVAYWGIGFSALGYWVATRLIKPLNGRVNSLYAARQIEKTQPALKSSLLTLTDLKQAGRATSGQIRGSLEKRAAIGLSKADVEEAVDRSALMKCSYALLFLLAVFCGYALLSPKSIVQSAWRAFVPFTSTGVATRTRIDQVDPGNVEVPALSHLDVSVEISGNAPQEVTLYYTTADGAFVDEALPLRDTGEGLRRYRGTLIGPDGRGLRQNLTYHVVAGDARSANYSVTVIESPSAVVDSVDYEYQPYTGLANKTEPGGAIDAWEGTRVTVHATANQNVKSATILFSDTEDISVKAEEQPMIITDGKKLKASWQLAFRRDHSFPKFYRVQLKTEEGHEDPLPTLQSLNIRPDLPPKVEILNPKNDIQAPVNGFVGIAYRATDPDFKLRSLVLNLEHDGRILVTSPRLFTGPPDEESREGTHTLRLKDFNLAAGSRLTYWIEARDDFQPFGDRAGNRTLTPRLNIDLVEPQPPARAAEQEKTAENQAQEALQESRPDQGKPMGAENPGDERPQGEQKGSDSKPSNDAKPQEGQPEQQGEPNDGNNKGSESTRPGHQTSPMPADRTKDQTSEQKPAGTEHQQEVGDKAGDNQPGEQGKSGEKSESGDSKPGVEQRPDQGQRGGQKGTPESERQPNGQQSGPRDRAPDDTALQKLIEWEKKQQDLERRREQSENDDPSQPNDSKPNDSKPNEQRGAPGEKSSEGQRSPNEKSDPANPMKGQEKSPSPQAPEDRGAPKDNSQPKNDSTKSEQTKQPGEPGDMSSGEPMKDPSATGDKPGADGQKPGKSGNEDSPRQGQEKPGTSEDLSNTKKPGEQTGEASDSKKPGETGSKPDSAQKSGEKPGDPKADQTENSAQPPMDKQGTPGEKGSSPQNQDQKPGATGQQTKGTETPTGESGDRTQPKDQKPGTQETSGNSTQNPAGQSDEQGTREKGSGDPGSSKPGEGSGQKSPGKGEEGQGGEKSSTGEKSGTAKSNDGNKLSQPGSKPGGEPSRDAGSKPQDGGKSDGQSEKPGAEQKAGEQNQDPKGGSEKGNDLRGADQKGSGDKGGDQQGAGQKGSGQQSQDGTGQQGKPGDQGASGEQPGGGQSKDAKPGPAGSKPGMGGTGSSGQGAASAEGAPGEASNNGFKPDAPNLENMKKATNLALKRLQESMERGEIDPELQKELGFTDDELRSFMERLQERLADNGDDNSPEAQARRRQFEQLLKGINLQTETGRRDAGTGTGPSGAGFGSTRRPTPAEYRAAEQRYRESLNKKK